MIVNNIRATLTIIMGSVTIPKHRQPELEAAIKHAGTGMNAIPYRVEIHGEDAMFLFPNANRTRIEAILDGIPN